MIVTWGNSFLECIVRAAHNKSFASLTGLLPNQTLEIKMTNNDYRPSSTILCFENVKEASLYFDRVLPLNMGRMRGDSTVGDILVGYPEEVPSAALSHLIDGIEGNTVTYSHATRVMEFTANRWVEFAKEVEPYARLWSSDPSRSDNDDVRNQYQKLQESYFADASIPGVTPIREAFRRYAKGIGFDHFCVAVPSAIGSGGSQCDPSITLSKLNLIDASQAEWRQIIELRKDTVSHRKLARLRLFIHKNYADCSFAYIEDDLSQRLEEYERVTKKFGLKTTLSSLSLLLDAKDLQTSAGAGLVAGLFGGPLIGLSAAAAIEVGKIAVNIAEKHHDLKDWQSGHELAFIFDTKKALS